MVEPKQTEPMPANRTGTRMLDWSNRFLSHRLLPVFLAIGAILVMLPALKVGLFWDDLPQRAVELRPSQLPSRMYELGIPSDSGSFSTVLNNLFNYLDPTSVARAKDYGIVPWWAPDHMNVRLALWRPVTAFTHWFDYRLFPDSPMPMHAENIAVFAAIVFVVTVIYRKLGVTDGIGLVGSLALPAAGLAGLLFLLDYNTYFPVMYVANRGFMLSLLFGLLCFYQHHQWRSTKSTSRCVLSALFLALSLFADEVGASTFAFILAYALVLEPGPFRSRALTILPAILVIVLWRVVYTISGSGVFGIGIYIDPANEPLSFARVVIPRALLMLGGQLAGVAPDVPYGVHPSLQATVTAFFYVIAVAALAVLFPWVRRDKMAAFWLAVMLLAVIPAATVMPMSKNLGFVAVGAYGLIASFIAGVITRLGHLPERLGYRIVAWIACGLLVLAHVPGAILGRVVAVKATAHVVWGMNGLGDIGDWPNIGNENVIVVNPPSVLTFISAPFYKAYHHQPLPRTLRALVPGCTSFDVERTDDKTLVIQSKTSNIFFCDDFGPVGGVYLASLCDRHLLGDSKCKKGDRYDLNGLTVEVLESDASGLPSRVAFRFNTSLDSPDFHWLRFDLQMAKDRSQPYQPFKIPAIGQSVTLSAPHR